MQIKNRKLKINNKGITLIALVITIIVLLILAGVAIATLTGDNGILTKAAEAKEKTTEVEAKEAVQLEAMGSIDEAGKFNKEDFKTNVKKNLGLTDADIKDNGTTITVTYKGYDVTVDAKTGDVKTVVKTGEKAPEPQLSEVAIAKRDGTIFEKNTDLKDDYGNNVKVPEGFKILEDSATSVAGGVIIQDATYEGTIGSEFVWIPVGEIKKSETEIVTINLSRYTFDENGNETDKGAEEISTVDTLYGSCTEDTKANHDTYYENTIATDIEEFKLKASAEQSGGYYIGRYEARVDNVTLDDTEIGEYDIYNGTDTMWTGYKEGQLVTKPNSQVWNYVTQNKAAELSKGMYKDKTFTSDLMNSYAWDTAIVFIQKCSTKTNYANQKSLSAELANQGTNKLETDKQDKICNIWDMASNCNEWTTETSDYDDRGIFIYSCVFRGGRYSSSDYTAYRDFTGTTSAGSGITFRPLLYL